MDAIDKSPSAPSTIDLAGRRSPAWSMRHWFATLAFVSLINISPLHAVECAGLQTGVEN
jgi:hypothetical protein